MAIFQHCYCNIVLLLLVLLLSGGAAPSAATDHIVGVNRGWNPGINYSSWAHNQTFYVGDLISFRYQKNTYNVFEVNKTGYDNCTMDGYAGNWTSGKDFIPLNKSQTYYFICNGFCFGGMKVSIVVHPLPKNVTARDHDTQLATRGSATANLGARNVGLRESVMVWFMIVVGFGFGLI
ncbi:hypothetical protein LUZ60_002208 [Juncus effusus]|nr:hypothetical protein LUZ60_002208 [Juncus effusus]